MARGRPPSPRGVYSFEDPTLLPPGELALDTSFVVHALVPRQVLHPQCRGFLERVSESDGTVFFNRLLEVELAEALFKIAVKEQHGNKGWPTKRLDGRVRRRAGRLMEEAFEAWNEVLDAVNWARIELHEVAEAVPSLMRDFGLSSNDAVHAATTEFAGAAALVTTDSDFAAVPADRLVLLTPASLVGATRRKRTP